jgi:hypothetical protein
LYRDDTGNTELTCTKGTDKYLFAWDVPDMGYQSESDVMGSLLPLVKHMQSLSYKCKVYINKSIGYTTNWEYMQKYNIILTKYLVKTIE